MLCLQSNEIIKIIADPIHDEVCPPSCCRVDFVRASLLACGPGIDSDFDLIIDAVLNAEQLSAAPVGKGENRNRRLWREIFAHICTSLSRRTYRELASS